MVDAVSVEVTRMDVLKKVPVREQEPEIRAKNFDEVCLGYNEEEAKAEAARIIERANVEAELEKQKVADEVKQQIVTVAAVMASKLVARSIDEKDSNALIEETLNEMGEKTWLS